ALVVTDAGNGDAVGLFGFPTTFFPVTVAVFLLMGVVILVRTRQVVARQLAAERQEAELSGQLVHAARLASVGELAAGIAHEINNPLSYVMSNVDYSLEELEDLSPHEHIEASPEIQTSLQDIQSALESASRGTEKVRAIIDDLRVFSRTGDEPTHPVSIHKPLDAALRMTERQFQDVATVVVDAHATPRVEADEPHLTQALVNLLINAAQALQSSLKEGAEIHVRTFFSSPWVVVEVEDNGPGIPPDIIDRIFDPFFTTKPAGKGTGLGLSMVRNTIERYGGKVSVESKPGEGTTFRILLPVSQEDVIHAPDPPPAPDL
ncbi:MAG: sensor histidine kinase, partial [Bradymonadaceae bacterium]